MRAGVFCLLLSVSACGPEAPKAEKKIAASTVADESRYFPAQDRLSTRVVPSRLLASSIAPGGTLGEYKVGSRTYQLGLIHMPSNDKAAFMLLDVKKIQADAHYLANMGGYYGMSNGVPLYVFAKGRYVAMVRGLPMNAADPIARTFAALIP